MRYRHWLDGDGMVCSLRFGREGVHFTNRFVRTRKLQDEEAVGRFLYRGFGTAFRGDRLRRNLMLEPPVNVSVYPYAGRLLALGEQTLPYELDPGTLATRGEYDFRGALNEVTPFSAHAKLDRGLLNFGVAFSATRPALNVFEFDAAANLVSRRRYPLQYPHSIHDFGFTPHRVLFFLSPFLMNFERFSKGGASVMESLSWQPELGSHIFVAPRAGSQSEPFTVEAGAGYCLHVINCFEDAGRLAIDVLLLDAPVYSEYQPVPDLFATAPLCRPARFVIDQETRAIVETRAMDYSLAQDFPSIDVARAGRAYDDFWMLGISQRAKPGRKFFDQLAHGSWPVRRRGRHLYCATRGIPVRRALLRRPSARSRRRGGDLRALRSRFELRLDRPVRSFQRGGRPDRVNPSAPPRASRIPCSLRSRDEARRPPVTVPTLRRWIAIGFLALLLNAAYVWAFAFPTVFYMTNVLAHLALGVALSAGLVWLLRRNFRGCRCAARRCPLRRYHRGRRHQIQAQ